MFWLIGCTIIYTAVIAAMCLSNIDKIRRPPDKKIQDFIKKNTKRYK